MCNRSLYFEQAWYSYDPFGRLQYLLQNSSVLSPKRDCSPQKKMKDNPLQNCTRFGGGGGGGGG